MTDVALVPVEAREALTLAPSPMTDDEIQRTYRTAQALAASGIYKDVRSAEQAFAKLLIGRSLGIGDHQALGLYVMDGKVELPYNLMGALVRSRDGYNYRAAWIKQDGNERIAVWCDEENLTDMRDIVGAAIQFTVGGEQRGVSRWTVEDSVRAKLDREGGNHRKFPRNMFLARAMSNGIKWFVPEVASGMPVYGEGEIERVPNLSAPETASTDGPGWGDLTVQQIAAVERIIRRAAKLGHKRLADKPTAQMALVGQSEARVEAWMKEARATLTSFAKQQSEPEDAEVVEGVPVEDATDEPRVEDASAEPPSADVCPVCEQPVSEHTQAQTDECNSEADRATDE